MRLNFILNNVKKTIKLLKKYHFEKSGYRYSLIGVDSDNIADDKIILHVIVQGIKKQIFNFHPDDIVYDDELLSEFSPCDVRAITYLSFQKYMKEESYDLIIEKQHMQEGKTIFFISESEQDSSVKFFASELYQNHQLLTRFNKKDMVNIISTAIQEQIFLDFHNMGVL